MPMAHNFPVHSVGPLTWSTKFSAREPGDLPVERPPNLIWSSLTTAEALGLHLPALPRPRRRGDRMRPARVHVAARRRGGVAAAMRRTDNSQRCR